jgi:hypothetical protein
MIGHVVAICFFNCLIWLLFTILFDGIYFNPKDNYEKWYELNWCGTMFFTILYWIIFLPITLIVGIVWVIFKMFTVGRN